MPKGIGHKKFWKIQTIRLSEEDLKKLDELGEKKYRNKSRAAVVRLMIEDVWVYYQMRSRMDVH
jgi:predicted DNA-binding protein